MNFLVGYTGAIDLDKRVIALAKQHAKAFNAKIYIAKSMESASEEQLGELERLQAILENEKNDVLKEGIPCETHLLIRGVSPWEDLLEFARDHRIDQIFIGIAKKSKVGKLIFGSNAQQIILEAPCPVTSVK